MADVFVVRNLTGDDVVYSMKEMQKRINNSQIVMIRAVSQAVTNLRGSVNLSQPHSEIRLLKTRL